MERKLNRRDFIKLLAASVAAAGLSHFRVLNFGGTETVLADGCSVLPDTCSVGVSDICSLPLVPDTCSTPEDNADHCGADLGDGRQVADTCAPQADPDVCQTDPYDMDECPDGGGTSDTCATPDPDMCNEGTGTPDTCGVGNPDVCQVMPGDPDECQEPLDPDQCLDAGIPDTCGGAPADPDYCEDGQVPDTCVPTADPDSPNAVSLREMQGASSLLTALGGAAVVVAGAVLMSKDSTG